MEYTPSPVSSSSVELSLRKEKRLAILRKILLAMIIATAVTVIGWFVYIKFFMPKEKDGAYWGTREGIANMIRTNSEPVPEAVRMQVLGLIRNKATITVVNSSGEVGNSTPVADREAILKRLSAGR